METYLVHTSNQAHYAIFEVTASDKGKAGERALALIKEEEWEEREHLDQIESPDADSLPPEDFIYTIDLIEEANHSTDLMVILAGDVD